MEHFVGPEGGPGFRDGFGRDARFNFPEGIWSDGTNLYVADTGNAVIRKIVIATGQVTTFAGRPQEKDVFSRPEDIWGDGTSLYVTDGSVIRKVDLATGSVSLFVDAWSEPPAITPRGYNPPRPFAISGNSTHLYVFYSAAISNTGLPIGSPAVREISRATGAARTIPYSSHGGAMPRALWATDQFVYFAYAGSRDSITLGRLNLSINEFEPLFGFPLVPVVIRAGTSVPAATPALNLWGDSAGHLFFAAENSVYEVELSTGRVAFVASVPSSIPETRIGGLWGVGNLLFGTNTAQHTVFRIERGRHPATVFAGTGPRAVAIEPPPSSTLFGVRGMWSDGRFLYLAAGGIEAIEILTGGSATLPSNIDDAAGVWGDGTYVYISRITDRTIVRFSLRSGETSTLATGFFFPAAITGDSQSLYVVDGNAIRRVSKATGAVTPLAGESAASGYVNGTGTAARFAGIRALWTDGITVFAADEDHVRNIVIATGEVGTFADSQRFGSLTALAGSGRFLYLGDSHRIRRVALDTAEVTNITESSDHFSSIDALWTDGRQIYAADGRLRKIDLSTRTITTVAGANVVFSQGIFPSDIFSTQSITGRDNFVYAVNGYGLYKISIRTRQVTHLAGAFNEPGTADGPPDEARFYSPTIIASDSRYVYVDEYVTSKIRRVDMQTGVVTTFISGMSARVAWTDGRYLYAFAEYDPAYPLYRIDLNTAQKTLLATGFYIPVGMWGDGRHLYVTEYRGLIKKVNLNTGATATLAGTDGSFTNLGAITGDGRLLYVIDSTTVRAVDPQTGETHTIAGQYGIAGHENGTGSDAHFIRTPDGKSSIWSDGTNLYVAHGEIRRIVLTRPLTTVPFNLAATGGEYWKAVPTAETLRVGSGRVQTSGGRPPASAAVFSFRPNGILVSEAAVPASAPVRDGRVYAEVRGAVNTGIAIANPNGQTATVSFYFTDASGSNFGAGNTTIGPDGQVAAFFNEPPFRPLNSSISVTQARTFTFSASLPVGVIALRGYTNERSEFLMTTLPVGPVVSSSADPIVLPHFADGGGWQTQVLLVNPTDRNISGTVTMDSTVNYSIAPRSSVNIASPGTGMTTHTGTVRITP